ncbi:MAG TPA: cation:proton antiporter [Phycisphaerales bacterium]|nr:cation:proton antiporter [Phycisphaerales bacterium]
MGFMLPRVALAVAAELKRLPSAPMSFPLPLAVSNHAAPPIFAELVIILLAASVVAILLQRLKFATIPAYLICGTIIGPGAIGLVRDPERVRQVADVALILLLFGVGLHLDLHALSLGVRKTLAVAAGAFAICVLLLWPLGMLLGISAPAALTAAMAVSMSSTAVVLRVLQQRHELGHPDGRLSVAILIVQDLLAIVVMMILSPIARWESGATSTGAKAATGGATSAAPAVSAPPQSDLTILQDLLLQGGIALAGVALLFLLGRFVVPRILNEAAKLKSLEVITVVSAATALGAAVLTQFVGLNPALGAFLAGFLLAATPFRHHLGGQVSAFRDVFAAVFFTAMGMSLSPVAFFKNLPMVIGVTLVILVIKTLVIGICCWLGGSTPRVSMRVGVALAQAGEFSVVIVAAASTQAMGLLDERVVALLLAAIIVSLMATPGLIHLAGSFAKKFPSKPLVPWASAPVPHRGHGPAHVELKGHAIIAGFGLVGRVVADKLKSMGVEVTIVEMNPGTIEKQTRLGRSIIFGDIANPDVLESAGVTDANALILTIPDEETVLGACRVAKGMNPDIQIVARTSYMSKGITAATLGATGVVVEEMATAEAMEKTVAKVLEIYAREHPSA